MTLTTTQPLQVPPGDFRFRGREEGFSEASLEQQAREGIRDGDERPNEAEEDREVGDYFNQY